MPDTDPHLDWQVVLQPASGQRKVVLWNPILNELQVSQATSLSAVAARHKFGRHSTSPPEPKLAPGDAEVEQLDSSEEDESTPPRNGSLPNLCPLCYSPLGRSSRPMPTPRQRILPLPSSDPDHFETSLRRVPSYFQLLSEANSLANTPTTTRQSQRTSSGKSPSRSGPPLDQTQFNEGYFAKFFEEIQLLGKGGQGVVYLVRHLLNGEALGLYACKKSKFPRVLFPDSRPPVELLTWFDPSPRRRLNPVSAQDLARSPPARGGPASEHHLLSSRVARDFDPRDVRPRRTNPFCPDGVREWREPVRLCDC